MNDNVKFLLIISSLIILICFYFASGVHLELFSSFCAPMEVPAYHKITGECRIFHNSCVVSSNFERIPPSDWLKMNSSCLYFKPYCVPTYSHLDQSNFNPLNLSSLWCSTKEGLDACLSSRKDNFTLGDPENCLKIYNLANPAFVSCWEIVCDEKTDNCRCLERLNLGSCHADTFDNKTLCEEKASVLIVKPTFISRWGFSILVAIFLLTIFALKILLDLWWRKR